MTPTARVPSGAPGSLGRGVVPIATSRQPCHDRNSNRIGSKSRPQVAHMNSPWYTSEHPSLSSTEPQTGGEPPSGSWIKRWWPGLVAVVVVIAVVAVVAVVLPRNRGTAGPEIHETPDEKGSIASVPVSDDETGERVVEGDEAPVGGGRDTRLIAGHVTVIVPDDSVSGEGTIRVRRNTTTEAPEGLSAVADAVDVALEGATQVGAFTMEAALPAEVGARSFQATATGSEGCCEAQAGRWDAERNVLVSEVPHAGLESFFSLPMQTLEDFAERLIGDRFSPRLVSVEDPDCPHEPDPQVARWELSADGDDSIRWCLEQLDSGGTELRVRNLRPHAVMIGYPAGIPPLRLEIPYPLPSWLMTANEYLAPVAARMVVLQRGDIARIDLSSAAEDFEALLTTSSNTLAWTGDFFDIALDVVIGAYAKIPLWAKPTGSSLLEDRPAALESLDQTTCIQQAASGEELMTADRGVWSELANLLKSCLQGWVTDQMSQGWLQRAMREAAGMPLSALDTLLETDSLNPEAPGREAVITRHPPEPQPTTGPRTRPTSPPRSTGPTTCPNLELGTWRGRWTSDGVGSGSFDARIEGFRPEVTGTIVVTGSTYVPGGRLTGQVQCARITFGRIDRQVEFSGTLSVDGRSMSGTYTAYSAGTRTDEGSFSAAVRE